MIQHPPRTFRPEALKVYDLCESDLENFSACPPGNAYGTYIIHCERGGHIVFTARGNLQQVRKALLGQRLACCYVPEHFSSVTRVCTIASIRHA